MDKRLYTTNLHALAGYAVFDTPLKNSYVIGF